MVMVAICHANLWVTRPLYTYPSYYRRYSLLCVLIFWSLKPSISHPIHNNYTINNINVRPAILHSFKRLSALIVSHAMSNVHTKTKPKTTIVIFKFRFCFMWTMRDYTWSLQYFCILIPIFVDIDIYVYWLVFCLAYQSFVNLHNLTLVNGLCQVVLYLFFVLELM